MDANTIMTLWEFILALYGAKALFDNKIDRYLGISDYWGRSNEYKAWARDSFGDKVFTTNHCQKHLTLYRSVLEELWLSLLEAKAGEFRDKHHAKDTFHIVRVGAFVHIFFGDSTEGLGKHS